MSKQKREQSPASADPTEKDKRFRELQRRSDAQKLPKELEGCLVDILDGEKLTKDTLGKWGRIEPSLFMHLLESFADQLTGKDKDTLLEKIEDVLDEETKSRIWEREHVNIENALDSLVRENNRFIARIEIANKTGYSLSTIERHIGSYAGSTDQKRKYDELLLLRERLLSRCYILATGGDIKAMRLFFEATADRKTADAQPTTAIQNQQNNFIQIDNLIITEDKIRQLPDETRNLIKDLLSIRIQKEGDSLNIADR